MDADADANANADEDPTSPERDQSTVDTHTDPKPILLLICPHGLSFYPRFHRTLLKLQRDAQLLHAPDLSTLDTHLATHTQGPPPYCRDPDHRREHHEQHPRIHIPLDPPRHARTDIPRDIRVRLSSATRAAPAPLRAVYANDFRTVVADGRVVETTTTDDGVDNGDEGEDEEDQDGDENDGVEGSNATSAESGGTGSQPGDGDAPEEDGADDEMSHDDADLVSTADDDITALIDSSYVLSDNEPSYILSGHENSIVNTQVADSAVVLHKVTAPRVAPETGAVRGYVGLGTTVR
ncbi:hypothetical protein BJX96DRAFT_174069 [Aspergillus floccosus]